MNGMRKLLLVPLLALALCGCGGLDDPNSGSALQGVGQDALSAEEATKPEVPEGALVDQSGDFVFSGRLQQIGDDTNGYLKVPLGYIAFQEEGIEGMTQYADATGKNIFTLRRYKDLTYQMAAENMRSYLTQQDTVQDLQGATVTVAGYNALQLYGHYSDGFYIVIWFIEDPANPQDSYYLAIECDSSHTNLIACSSSFRTIEDYHNEEAAAEQEGTE